MAPRTEEQFEEIRESKRALIMDTALEMFANEGYHQSSISKIAQKAGIAKGLMYNYFKSKEELLVKIMSVGMEEMAALFDPDNDGILTEDEMKNFIREIFKMVIENNRYWKLYYAIFLQPQVNKLISERFEEIFEKFMGMLVEYYKSHGLKNPETEALLFGALLDGMAFNYIMNPNLFPMEIMVETVIDKFCYIK